jgi:hypothetical protein
MRFIVLTVFVLTHGISAISEIVAARAGFAPSDPMATPFQAQPERVAV